MPTFSGHCLVCRTYVCQRTIPPNSAAGFLTIYNIVCIFTIIFACIPVSAYWDLALQGTAKCFSAKTYSTLGVLNSVVGIVSDVLLALLPIPVIAGLQLTRRTKIALSCVMALGLVAVGAGAVKVHAQFTFLEDKDRLYHDRFSIWAAIELYFGIAAASIPTLKPLFVAVLNSARSTMQASTPGRDTSSESSSYRKKADSCMAPEVYSDDTPIATPAPAVSKEVSSYFSFYKKHAGDLQTQCSRADSIRMGNITWTEAPELPTAPLPEDDKPNCIVRTTHVTTVSEPAPESMQAEIMLGAPKSRPSSGEVPQRGLSRQASIEGGFHLKHAQMSEEDLPKFHTVQHVTSYADLVARQ